MAEETKKAKKRRPQAEKRVLQDRKITARNSAMKSAMRTRIRALRTLMAENKKEEAQKCLSEVYSILDKGVQKGVIKPNKASRSKQRLATQAQKIA